ncbi:unnamed protein product, partial [Prorocentrum cordatum]
VELPLRGGGGEEARGLLLVRLLGLGPAAHAGAQPLPADWASGVDELGLPFRYRGCGGQAGDAPAEAAAAPHGGAEESAASAEGAEGRSPRRPEHREEPPA